jgi:sialate O-acetylesterase
LNIRTSFPAIVAVLLLHYSSTYGQVRLPRLISDGMVLQRDVQDRIWGYSSPGQTVTVHFLKETYNAETNADGKWILMLHPHAAGGPYTMDIDAINHIMLRNVYIGEVWVCSGQSNMDLSMERVKDKYPDVIAHADNPVIRQFTVAKRYAFSGQEDDLSSGHWEGAGKQTILSFSATAYFFARALYEKYHVPIGLIKVTVGGAPAEAWMSEDGLRQFPVYGAIADKFKDTAYVDSIRQHDDRVSQEWYERIWHEDKGLHGDKPWYDPGYDASSWPTMQLPGYWADQGLGAVNGVLWFRKVIDVPASMAASPAKLWLGEIIDRDSVFVNGVFAGTTGYRYPPRKYMLPANLLKAGKNTIVIRVISNEGQGGFVPGMPYRLMSADGGQAIDLGGAWQYQTGALTDPLPAATTFQYQPLGLFNGMIAPLLPYTIKGVIWYQGESNAGKAWEYATLFPAMITDWRHHWRQGNFSFLYVQLPNFMAVKEQPSESHWAELREAQRRALAIVPNTGMAVTIDIGESNELHPPNKEDVGKRLALVAEKVAYGQKQVVHSGPLYHSMKIEKNKIRLKFNYTSITDERETLIVKGGGDLKGFAIAGADKKYVWAKAKIDDKEIIVWSDEVPKPLYVRYAWADNPEGANLYNREGLPASPFQTDNILPQAETP